MGEKSSSMAKRGRCSQAIAPRCDGNKETTSSKETYVTTSYLCSYQVEQFGHSTGITAVSLIEQEKAQIVKDRAEVLKNLDEHLQLERQQQEGRFKV